jgi:[protein-PII] uridylyltransferase
MAALLHDLGKGGDGDHTEAGVQHSRRITERMGFPSDDAATIVALVEHHLLLADVAVRRDLDELTTIERVAAKVGSEPRLRLLAALTEADSLATGPSAWGASKVELVGLLVDRAAAILSGEPPTRPLGNTALDESQFAQLALSGDAVDGVDDTLTVITRDQPGVFCRIAGVLALHGLDVLAATAQSPDGGRAIAQFRVVDPVREQVPWDRVKADVSLALDGRLAIGARLAERARTYRRHAQPSARPATARVSFDIDASSGATVIDVQAADGIGVLYRITRALAELDLDIRSARVQTMGDHVVDAFYVRDAHGDKISDTPLLREIERAILHSLDT